MVRTTVASSVVASRATWDTQGKANIRFLQRPDKGSQGSMNDEVLPKNEIELVGVVLVDKALMATRVPNARERSKLHALVDKALMATSQ